MAKSGRNRAGGTGIRAELDRALAAHRAGAFDEAARLYEAVLTRAPRHGDALNLLGVLKMQTGDAATGLTLVDRAVKADRRQPAFHNNRGEILRALDRDAEALAAFEAALKLDARFTDASINAAFAACALQRLDLAGRYAARALKGASNAPEAHMAVAEVCRLSGDAAGALEAARGAQRLAPDEPQVLGHMAGSLVALGRGDEAEQLLERALSLSPAAVEPRFALAELALQRGDFERAAELGRHILRMAPTLPEAHRLGGDIAGASDSHREACTYYERARQLGLRDDAVVHGLARSLAQCHEVRQAVALLTEHLAETPTFETHTLLGNLLLQDGQGELALSHYEAALARCPSDALATLHMGDVLATLGRHDDALAAVRRAVELDPTLAVAFETLAYIGGAQALDGPLQAQAANLARSPDLPPEARASAHFACAIAQGGQFEHYAAGNDLLRERYPFDVSAHQAYVDRIVRVLGNEAALQPLDLQHDKSTRMVFIVGLPRSGTSLAEQILASHRDVFGAGEVEFFNHLTYAEGPGFPESVAALSGHDLEQMRDAYLKPLRVKAGDAEVITDKMPGNYLYLGLIARLFPNARIVNMRRDPMDNCLSVYFQNFTAAAAHAYSFDLETLGRYYREYERLMAHWHRVLRLSVLNFSYEALVAAPEERTRELLEFCGLEWDSAVLDFHTTERDVNTASHLQVRQPIYRSAVARWRRYEDHLRPLRRGLGLDQEVR